MTIPSRVERVYQWAREGTIASVSVEQASDMLVRTYVQDFITEAEVVVIERAEVEHG